MLPVASFAGLLRFRPVGGAGRRAGWTTMTAGELEVRVLPNAAVGGTRGADAWSRTATPMIARPSAASQARTSGFPVPAESPGLN